MESKFKVGDKVKYSETQLSDKVYTVEKIEFWNVNTNIIYLKETRNWEFEYLFMLENGPSTFNRRFQ
jgi:hypothetical protein